MTIGLGAVEAAAEPIERSSLASTHRDNDHARARAKNATAGKSAAQSSSFPQSQYELKLKLATYELT